MLFYCVPMPLFFSCSSGFGHLFSLVPCVGDCGQHWKEHVSLCTSFIYWLHAGSAEDLRERVVVLVLIFRALQTDFYNDLPIYSPTSMQGSSFLPHGNSPQQKWSSPQCQLKWESLLQGMETIWKKRTLHVLLEIHRDELRLWLCFFWWCSLIIFNFHCKRSNSFNAMFVELCKICFIDVLRISQGTLLVITLPMNFFGLCVHIRISLNVYSSHRTQLGQNLISHFIDEETWLEKEKEWWD